MIGLVLGYLLLGVVTFYFLAYWCARETLPPFDWWCSWARVRFVLFVVALWPVVLGLWMLSVRGTRR